MIQANVHTVNFLQKSRAVFPLQSFRNLQEGYNKQKIKGGFAVASPQPWYPLLVVGWTPCSTQPCCKACDKLSNKHPCEISHASHQGLPANFHMDP
jgi:hypothetical protein